jgi:hypothetical protein
VEVTLLALGRVVNRIVLILFVLVVTGLSSFGQTNASPGKDAAAVSLPQQTNQTKVLPANPLPPPPQKLPAKLNDTNIASVYAPRVLSTTVVSAEPDEAQTALFRRIEREGLLKPGNFHGDQRFQERNFGERSMGEKMRSIFRSDNDQMGDTSIDGAYDIIFPTGH